MSSTPTAAELAESFYTLHTDDDESAPVGVILAKGYKALERELARLRSENEALKGECERLREAIKAHNDDVIVGRVPVGWISAPPPPAPRASGNRNETPQKPPRSI